MLYKKDWDSAKVKWKNYWNRSNNGRPLLCLIARKPETEAAYEEAMATGKKLYEPVCQGADYLLPDQLMYTDVEDKYLTAHRMVDRYRHFCETHEFLAESFPNINVDFGPGSIAGYLGSNIEFRDDTVWFQQAIDDWAGVTPLVYDPENKWWKKHYQLVTDIRQLVGDDFYIGMPDLMENLDVINSLRGAENTIFDMIDYPEEITARVQQVTDVYFEYYDRFYDLIKLDSGEIGSAYTVFQIYGEGRTAKLQCDFAAMMSPSQVEEFVQPALRQQAKKLDNVLFHLDGPDCIKHTETFLDVNEIDALQWTSGDYGPDGTLEEWDQIYDIARRKGKSLWVKVYSGGFEDWVKSCDRLVKKYGSHSLFFMLPEMSMAQAETFLNYAEKNWSDIEGTFRP